MGYVGMGLLLAAYLSLITPFAESFTILAAIASLILTIHAVRIKDTPFTVVNGFITLILVLKLFNINIG